MLDLKYFDKVREISATSGTGDITLSGVNVLGYRTFTSVLVNGDQFPYSIQDGPDWETGIGTFNSGAFSRTPTASSTGSLINFTAPIDVFMSPIATIFTDVADHSHALDDLTDVTITTAAAGQILKRNSGNTLWVNDKLTATEVGSDYLHGVSVTGTLSWVNATRTITVTGLQYYYKGTQVTVASASIQIANTVGLWFISFNSIDGTLSAVRNTPWDLNEVVTVATIHWNGTLGATTNEQHGHRRDIGWHKWAHLTIGVRYGSGLDMIAPALNTPSTISFTGGTIWDEDIAATIQAATQCRLWYETAAGVWNWTVENSLYGAAVSYVDTPSYTLTAITTAQYMVYWVYATPDITIPIYSVMSSVVAPYTTIAQARAAIPPNLAGTGISPEVKLLYKVIFRGDETFNEFTDYRNSSVLPAGGTASTSAASVTSVASGRVTATNVQTAIEQLAIGCRLPDNVTGLQYDISITIDADSGSPTFQITEV